MKMNRMIKCVIYFCITLVVIINVDDSFAQQAKVGSSYEPINQDVTFEQLEADRTGGKPISVGPTAELNGTSRADLDKSITKALIEHHDEMRKLVTEIKKDPSKFIILKKHLDIHHELEEDLLLSKLHVRKEIKDESHEAQEEHFVLNFLLLDLANFPTDDSRWMVKFKVFEEILDHHLTEEEEDLFPEAENLLTKEEQTAVGAKFTELKERRLSAALETKPARELEKPKKAD